MKSEWNESRRGTERIEIERGKRNSWTGMWVRGEGEGKEGRLG